MKPNIVVLTAGRSGSTIVCQMLEQLGWTLPNADEYAEHRVFRSLNECMIRNTRKWSTEEVDRVCESLPDTPWVLKDPRLLWTFETWKPHLDREGNLLLWVYRDSLAVEQSLRRQAWGKLCGGSWRLRGLTVLEMHKRAARHFHSWQHAKLEIRYEDLCKAVSLFSGPFSN